MRLFGTIAALVVVSGCATQGCATQPGGGTDARAEEELTANNAMGLRLVYDEGSQRLRATLERRLADGESLRLAARHGRLAADAAGDVDCAALPLAPALPAAEADAAVVYEGPEIAPSLLANVYEPAWIIGRIAAPLLDRLAREGADSIVEACIVDEATQSVTSTLQTSIQCAWDERDPSAMASLDLRSCAAPPPQPQGQQ